MQQRYKVGQLGAIRILRDGGVEVELPRGLERLPMDRFQLLLQFAQPASLAEVHDLVVDVPESQFLSLVEDFERRGLLERADDRGIRGGPALTEYLAPQYRSSDALSAIGHHLSKGRCVVLENALDVDLAERVYAALVAYDGWRLDHDYSQPDFSFRHHKIPDGSALPDSLNACAAIFGSDATKTLMDGLSNRDCGGDLAFGASLYLPGDYALPHSDAIGVRNVTLNWYLTKDWAPNWGGKLHWCPTWQSLAPAFNTLALFNVSPESRHFVSQVRPTARGRRLTVNTWWLSRTADGARKALHEPAPHEAVSPQDVPGLRVLGG